MASSEPYNDTNIKAGDIIIRRINPKQHKVFDHNRNCYRISTKAYSPSSGPNGGMSVDIEALIVRAGKDPKKFVTTPVYTGSVAFSAGQVRGLDLLIGHTPKPDNPYHGDVWANKSSGRFSDSQKRPFSGSQKRSLLNAAKWYVELPGVCISTGTKD